MLDSYLPTEKEEVTFSIFKAKDLLEYGLGLNFVVAKKNFKRQDWSTLLERICSLVDTDEHSKLASKKNVAISSAQSSIMSTPKF